MKLILTRNLDNMLMTRIEYLYHFKSSYEYILNDIIKPKSKYRYDKELLDYYMQNFNKVNTEFKLLSNQIIESIDKKYLNQNKYYSEYVFDDGIINIYEYDEVKNNENKKMDSISRSDFKNNAK